MKIAVCSDLHLEFGPISLENTEGADVLILSGDICVAHDVRERDSFNLKGESDKSNKIHTFFEECCARFPNVIYIMGNHEHYHGDFAQSVTNLRDRLGYLGNLHILDKEFVEFNGVCFAGGTLWTDMNKEDPHTLYSIKGYMNDYRIIQNSNEMVNYKVPVYKTDADGNYVTEKVGENHTSTVVESYEFKTRPAKFAPEDSVVDHKAMLQFIKESIESRPDMPWVVVGHHAPSKLSTKPQYEKDVMVNGAYSSDLSEFILDHPQIKVWTHGHTHHPFDYMIGSTRIVCNPRGYDGYEGRADEFELMFVEV
jgi:predicted phosphodiesterase